MGTGTMPKKRSSDTQRPLTHIEDPILSIREVAEQFGKSSQTVGRWIHDGLLRVIRLPSGMPGVRQSDVDAFLGGSALNKPPPKEG